MTIISGNDSKHLRLLTTMATDPSIFIHTQDARTNECQQRLSAALCRPVSLLAELHGGNTRKQEYSSNPSRAAREATNLELSDNGRTKTARI